MCYRHKTADPKKSSNKIYTDILKPGKFITAYLKNVKIWFIVGYRTYSTSEVLLNALIEFKNISIAGQLTGGGAGNPKIFKLPFSGFEINIPVTEIYKPYNLAETIETNPVVPDKIIDQSIEDYHEGKDTVLKYLLESV